MDGRPRRIGEKMLNWMGKKSGASLQNWIKPAYFLVQWRSVVSMITQSVNRVRSASKSSGSVTDTCNTRTLNYEGRLGFLLNINVQFSGKCVK
jgi:hypothetical protein